MFGFHQRGTVNNMILICGVCLLSEVRVKIGRGHVEDRRSRHCPYLDTINRFINMTNVIMMFIIVTQCCSSAITLALLFCFFRSVLDFDFEKLCSISLSHINVYACLICGKYFQGTFFTIYDFSCLLTNGR